MSFMKRNSYALYQITKNKLRWKGEKGQEMHLGARNVPLHPEGELEPHPAALRQGSTKTAAGKGRGVGAEGHTRQCGVAREAWVR